ncbi:MAG TPA: UTP--glucose-1-phosphate uridylyltransferase, partial [Nitrospirae bacterium]|nr:UTP--glucose-1-phosphate uridylyltransferase [Nitrospirota bacterium]
VDKPMIQYAVEEAEKSGIKEFLIITGKSKRTLEDHFDSAWELEENLKRKGKKALLREIKRLNHFHFAYIRQKAPLGLGHAILCSKPFIKDESFAVILSDDIIDPDDDLLGEMIKLYEEHEGTILALQRVPKTERHRYGIIAGNKIKKNVYEITDLVEKPKPSAAPSDIAIIGRYILTPDIFKAIETTPPGKGGEMQLTDALKTLINNNIPVYGYLFEGKRYDAGDKVGYLKATVELALKHPKIKKEFRKYLLKTLRIIHK